MGKRINDYLSEILDNITKIKEEHNRVYDSNLLIAYRGESRNYGKTKLMPSLFRNSTYVSKEKYLFELFSDYELIPHESRYIDKAIETQHYVTISRMLDITFSAIVSIYFACIDDKDEDGFIYIFGFPKHYSPHSNYVEDFYKNILNDKGNIAYFKNFKVFSHSYSNDRIKAQSGGFIFFPGESFHPLNDIYYHKVMINKEDKDSLIEDIGILFQINEAKLFPEKEKITKIIKQKFIEGNYLDRKVTLENEIDACLDKIDYEINLLKQEDSLNIKRYLRKEKSDLIYYVKESTAVKDYKIENRKEIDYLTNKIEDAFEQFNALI